MRERPAPVRGCHLGRAPPHPPARLPLRPLHPPRKLRSEPRRKLSCAAEEDRTDSLELADEVRGHGLPVRTGEAGMSGAIRGSGGDEGADEAEVPSG